MTKRILLKGYYGFGNLGDDILMLVSYSLLREIFPDHEILVCSNSPDSSYISKILQQEAIVVKDDARIKVDWLVNGGGGVFFDFKSGGVGYLLLNTLIRIIGFGNFRRIYTILRWIRGNSGIKARWRAGLGIGVGSYVPSSRKFYANSAELAAKNFLLVRDEASYKRVLSWKLKAEIHEATDLAFLTDYWAHQAKSPEKKSKIGFALRDWSYDNSYIQRFIGAASALKDRGHDVVFFLFDKFADKQLVNQLARHQYHVWDPTCEELGTYLDLIKACRLMVTSRAHGAIIGSCLGVPSVCIEIEPKLATVAKMLPESSVLIKPTLSSVEIERVISGMLENPSLADYAKQEARDNNYKMIKGLQLFKDFIANA